MRGHLGSGMLQCRPCAPELTVGRRLHALTCSDLMHLRTSRLLLREVRAEDWSALLRYRADPEFLRFYEQSEYTAEDAQIFVRRFLEWQAEEPRRKYGWAVMLPGSEVVIGICSIRKEEAGSHEAEIGFEFAAAYWGRGFASELGSEMLRFGFGELGLHRIQAHCIAENVASARVLQKLGMQQEGRLRDKQHWKGRYWDELRFGILHPEWSASQPPAT